MLPKALRKCHKTRLENCTGRLLEGRKRYGEWAYWCGKVDDVNHPCDVGWSNTPCEHQKA